MMEKDKYLRVGTCHFKKVDVPLISGDFVERIVKWSSEIIKQDHGQEVLKEIPKYDGFCVIPSHLNYQQVVGTYYNKYLPLEHSPKKGKCDNILEFIKHIFGDQYEIGLDYLKILYEIPSQKLPILCLVSSERSTGKTTFLNLLKAIFSGNMTINTNEDFRSNFNSDWAWKSIIAVDETFLDRKEDSEHIKTLSTAKVYKQESKGHDKFEIEFFGKFILCSNNVSNFVKIDPEEIRYWVREIPKLQKENNNLLEEMQSEISQFLYFLTHRDFSTHNKTRMWFTAEQIRTKALIRLKQNNKSQLEREIISYLKTIMEMEEISSLNFCIIDLQLWISDHSFLKFDSSQLRAIVKQWELPHCSNTLSYDQYVLDYKGQLLKKKSKGRYYTVTEEFLHKFDE